MSFLERDLNTHNLPELLELFVELFVSPVFSKTLDEKARLSIEFATLSVIWQRSAYFTIDLRESNLLNKFAC